MKMPIASKKKKSFILFVQILLVFMAIPGSGVAHAAQKHGGEELEVQVSVDEEHIGSEFHPNHLSVFLGITDDEEEREGTLGLDFERRLTRTWGVGAYADWAGGDIRSYVAGATFVIHPVGEFKILAAPGLEYDDVRNETEFLFRIGFMYDFEIGKYTLAPAFNIDFVDNEEVFVYGINFGRGW